MGKKVNLLDVIKCCEARFNRGDASNWKHSDFADLSRDIQEETKIDITHICPEFQLYTFAELAGWIVEIVRLEGPVHFDEMAKRITEAVGIAKVGSRIRYTLTQALDQAKDEGKVLVKGGFLSVPEMQTAAVRDRSKLPSAYKKLSLIAPEEIHEAIRQVVGSAIAITEQEAIPLVAKLLGFARVTEEMRQQLSEAVGKTIQLGFLTFDGLNLKLPN